MICVDLLLIHTDFMRIYIDLCWFFYDLW